jgi:flagellar hook-associated protein 2
MGRIQTSVGLISGVNISETVAALMKLAAARRDAVSARTDTLKNEQLAVVQLSALLLSVKYVTDNLGKTDLFDKRSATSSNTAALTATVTGTPTDGTYQFTPLRAAANQQYLSDGFAAYSEPIGAGSVTFRFGDHVQRTTPLDVFNGGQGFQRGKIRITDRSGASAQIDLSAARSVEDIIEAINGNTTINVTAEAHGDGLRLVDNTGASVSNLKVQEVAGGATAASLGLAGIDVAASTADGADVLWLDRELDLDAFNDGSGVSLASKNLLGDVTYTLRDGTTGTIDFTPPDEGEGVTTSADPPATLGELIDLFNSAAPGKLTLEIAPDGDRLIATDLTTGEGSFTLESRDENGSDAVADLGLGGDAVDGEIVGRRLLGGTGSVLLDSLAGGRGLGAIGSLELTDRSGASDSVDLSGAETLDDVIDAINAASVGITARVNEARNGIELVDTTGASASNLIVADGEGEDGAATALGIAVDAAVTSVNSGDLHLQVVSENTRLADFDGGAGVAEGDIIIINSAGTLSPVNLRATSSRPMQTIGDVIAEINRAAIGVVAEINATGDGIRIRDVAGGSGTLRVVETGGTTAADLHLSGDATTVEIDGEDVQVVDGSTTRVVAITGSDSLATLRQKVNALSAGVTASILDDGSSEPYRLTLRSDRSGAGGRLVLDTSQLGFSMEETVRGQDALLMLGGTVGGGILVSSATNRFTDVIPGVRLDLQQASETPLTITISQTDADVSANLQVMVDNYNKFREYLNEQTAWDETTQTGALLFGDSAALRLDSELSAVFSRQFTGAGAIRSLAELGIDIQQDGTLTYDATKFETRWAEDSDAVKEFFTTTDFGASDRLAEAIDSFTAQDVSLLAQRYRSLTDKIEDNEERIAFMDERLDAQEERLYLDFYRMELAIAKTQNNLSVIEGFQPLTPYTGVASE